MNLMRSDIIKAQVDRNNALITALNETGYFLHSKPYSWHYRILRDFKWYRRYSGGIWQCFGKKGSYAFEWQQMNMQLIW